jgi:hypothetical protein
MGASYIHADIVAPWKKSIRWITGVYGLTPSVSIGESSVSVAVFRVERRISRIPQLIHEVLVQLRSILSSTSRLSLSSDPASSKELVAAALPFSTLVIT